MSATYTAEYYAALEAKLEQHPHRCRQCKIADGAKPLDKYGHLMKSRAVVRLAIVNITKPPNDANNIDLYCTRCRKPGLEWRAPRKVKASKLPQLF